jgi:hypothetical protein
MANEPIIGEQQQEVSEQLVSDKKDGFMIYVGNDGGVHLQVFGNPTSLTLLGLLKVAESNLTVDLRNIEQREILGQLDVIGKTLMVLAQNQFGNLLKK